MSQDTSAAPDTGVAHFEAETVVIAGPGPLARFGAEFLGTFILVLAILATAMYGNFVGNAGTLSVALAGGIALLAAVAAFGHVSGGHFNPAVTLGAAIAGRTSWANVLPYWIGQIIGAVVAGLILLATAPYASEAQVASGGLPEKFTQTLFQATANGFASHTPLATATQGALEISLLSALLIETVVTAIFVGVILAVTDRRAGGQIAPVAIGLTLGALILVAAPFTNASLNPARSFASALFGGAWTWGQLWVFVVGPMVGAAIAALFYRVFTLTPAQDDLLGEDDVDELAEEIELPALRQEPIEAQTDTATATATDDNEEGTATQS